MNIHTRILVVDDEPSIRMALSLAMEQSGWQIDTVESAEEARSALEKLDYDLLLMDKNLPGIDGVEFIREIRARGDNTAVILITGYASVDSALETVGLGVEGYIEKPFDDVFGIRERVESTLAKIRQRGGDSIGQTGAPVESLSGAPRDGAIDILLVTPIATDREKIAAEVEKAGDRISHAATATEALYQVSKAVPDLLIVDTVVDPDVFGLLTELETRAPDLPCVVLVEHPSLDVITKLIDLGIKAVIEKPLDSALHEKVSCAARPIKLKKSWSRMPEQES
ncbi:MAG: response regulator [Deltaproteobacteria bacterium]|nr:response regulator [Deltaproteobacteria bacterium]